MLLFNFLSIDFRCNRFQGVIYFWHFSRSKSVLEGGCRKYESIRLLPERLVVRYQDVEHAVVCEVTNLVNGCRGLEVEYDWNAEYELMICSIGTCRPSSSYIGMLVGTRINWIYQYLKVPGQCTRGNSILEPLEAVETVQTVHLHEAFRIFF